MLVVFRVAFPRRQSKQFGRDFCGTVERKMMDETLYRVRRAELERDQQDANQWRPATYQPPSDNRAS